MAREEIHKKQPTWRDITPTQKHRVPPLKKRPILKKLQVILPFFAHLTIFKIAQKKITTLSRQKRLFIIIVCLLAVALYVFNLMNIKPTHRALAGNEPVTSTSLVKGTPDYKTLLPPGKSISDLGGWTRVSPPDRNPVFAYVDSINGQPINVSQQPLPTDFKHDTASQVSQLAQAFNATEKITVGDMTIYIGTSQKGPQSVIFVRDNLLILIKSTKKISDDQWAKYINSLR